MVPVFLAHAITSSEVPSTHVSYHPAASMQTTPHKVPQNLGLSTHTIGIRPAGVVVQVPHIYCSTVRSVAECVQQFPTTDNRF